MRIQTKWITVILIGFTLSLSAQRIELAKQLTENTGWISDGHRLYWTTNDGIAWQDVTPPQIASDQEVAAVFFLDAQKGWVVLSRWDDGKGTATFCLAVTEDAGVSWLISPLVLNSWKNLPKGLELNIPQHQASINFSDGLNGPVVIAGSLAITSDGGETWKEMSGPGFGSVVFTTKSDGWLSGESARLDYEGKLFVTHDGSKTWQEVILPGPVKANAKYGLPFFTDKDHGFLTVQYSGPSVRSTALFSTASGGGIWARDVLVPSRLGTAFAVVDGKWRVARLASHRLSVAVPSATSAPNGGGQVDSAITNLYRLSFVNSSHGWALTGTSGGVPQLFSTTDSGATWTNISPPQMKLAKPKSGKTRRLTWKKVDSPSGVGLSPSSDVSIHLGFDKFPVLTIDDMQSWWDSSPYYDVAVYLPGSANKSNDVNLNANWTSSIQIQGWGIIPIWFGAQPSTACRNKAVPNSTTCARFTTQISPTPATAYSQGVAEANAAIASLTAPGPTGVNLSGTIIYKDIENYVTGIDGPAVRQFLSGWSATLHSATPLSYLSGVYGNPSPAETDFASPAVTPPIDEAWIARANKQASTWGLWTLGGVTDTTVWVNDQRIHQYFNDHLETFGGKGPFGVDSDIEDAVIINGYGIKPYTYTAWDTLASPYTDSHGNSQLYVTDVTTPLSTTTGTPGVQDLAGTYYSHEGPESFSNFYYTRNGSFTTLTGADLTEVLGMNNIGTLLGIDLCANPVQCGVSGYWTWKAGNFTTLGTPFGLPLPYSREGGFCFQIHFRCAGINDAGQIVNTLCTDNSCTSDQGYLDQNGSYTTFGHVGGIWTSPVSINGQGQVLGWWADSSNSYVFIWSTANGFQNLPFPPGQNYPLKINDNGLILACGPGGTNCFLYDLRSGASAPVPTRTPPPGWHDFTTSLNDFADLVGTTEYLTGSMKEGLIITTQR